MTGGASSAGTLIFLPLLVFVTSEFGWRTALALLAVVMLAVILPLTFLLMRSRPADLGLQTYGMRADAPRVALDETLVPMRQALRTADFWLLSSTFFVCGFTTIGLIGSHFIPHATEHGFTEAQPAGILSAIGAMNVIGTTLSGWLCDRYPPRILLAGYYLFRALSAGPAVHHYAAIHVPVRHRIRARLHRDRPADGHADGAALWQALRGHDLRLDHLHAHGRRRDSLVLRRLHPRRLRRLRHRYLRGGAPWALCGHAGVRHQHAVQPSHATEAASACAGGTVGRSLLRTVALESSVMGHKRCYRCLGDSRFSSSTTLKKQYG